MSPAGYIAAGADGVVMLEAGAIAAWFLIRLRRRAPRNRQAEGGNRTCT